VVAAFSARLRVDLRKFLPMMREKLLHAFAEILVDLYRKTAEIGGVCGTLLPHKTCVVVAC
jgi:hypothetical protein